ncbi:hypothetical protein PVAG01_04131 [Phlyctema vagabunda]|uniref:F-box domain-containing protein n=1 Tax=Phlyctema vagabunda TaxID=108571 RepID=A0ABR4PNI2_9HELO
MATLLSLPPEILQLIFRALQATTCGPRYCLTPIDNAIGLGDSKPYARWELIDPGPVNLASTCRKLRDIYYLRSTAGNLILSIPRDFVPDNKGTYFDHWMEAYVDTALEGHLKRLKLTRKGSPLSRFTLDSEWEAFEYSIRPLCQRIWNDILSTVSEVFGSELAVVVLSQGRNVKSERRELAPIPIRELERLEYPSSFYTSTTAEPVTNTIAAGLSIVETLPSVSSRTRTVSLRSGRNPAPPIPIHKPKPSDEQLQSSAPLSLHIYFGWRQHNAEALWSEALVAFSNNNLQSLYISSDPNNLHLVGHSRRPAQGRQLYTVFNSRGNPWRHLLPDLTIASDTLRDITLDCSLFWSELAYILPYLNKLQKLDLELAVLHSEPMYPFDLLSKAEAESKVAGTCLGPKAMVKEKALKKNKNRKWLNITKEQITFSALEPINIQMPDAPHSRHATIVSEVCDQLHEIRLQKSRRSDC